MSTDTTFHYARITDEIITLMVDGRIYPKYFREYYNIKKRQLLKDINALRNMLYAKFGEDVSLIYNRKDKCYELLIIAGKDVVVDLPYSI